jgi:beta-lactamase superfamily II metal-dependent hydrolase
LSTRPNAIDGGYSDTIDTVKNHMGNYYGTKSIQNLVITHPDRDHASGAKNIIENCDVARVWMNRPWLYASELLDRFSKFSNVENLEQRLREIYPFLSAAESAAIEKGIPIYDAFQGTLISDFTVLAPSKSRFLDLIVESEKSPQSAKVAKAGRSDSFLEKIYNLKDALWGTETFSNQETASENEMSIIQYANICNSKVLLTGDAGRGSLQEAINYAPNVGLDLPGIDKFQVPHHGSRRNVSSDILDAILGSKFEGIQSESAKKFSAIISAAKNDSDHPKKAVIRAMWHRGGAVVATNGESVRSSAGAAPDRDGWKPVASIPYPDQEEE